MSYTDAEMKNFTQVAYADLGEAMDYLRSTHPGQTSFSIEELESVAKSLGSDVSSLSALTADQKQNWSISCVYDTNDQTGFYACVIETSPGEAAVAFRGSENAEDISNLYYDWLRSDLGLLNSTETLQHEEVNRFLSMYADELKKYDSLAMTGHSLGGNLAEYATIVSSRYGLDDKITKCISFDGPGFSNEFLLKYYNEINQMSSKMTHYRWSLVGGLLFDLPGVTYVTCKVKDKYNDMDHIVTRHSTNAIDFDKDGSVKKGDRDWLSIITDGISKVIDGASFNLFPFFMPTFMLFNRGFASLGDIFDSFVNGVKSTYQKIHDMIQSIFNRESRHFRVNTEALRSDSDKVNASIERVRKLVSEMFDSVQGLGGMWKGPANAAFAAKFAQEREEIETYLNRIKTYVDSIECDSKAYDTCELQVLNMVSSLKV